MFFAREFRRDNICLKMSLIKKQRRNKDATGFEVEKLPNDIIPIVYPTEIAKKAEIPQFGKQFKQNLMYIISPKVKEGDVVLGTYSIGKPAVVMRKTGKYPQVFCGGVDIPTELYRYVCEQTGIHVYNKDMAMVCANGPYISIFEFDMKMDDAKLLKIQD